MTTTYVLQLAKGGSAPLYRQVADALSDAISGGDLRPGDRLEDEITLAARLELSRPTVRRGIQELVAQGLLIRKRGVGTLVVTGSIDRPLQLLSLHDDLVRADERPSTRVLLNTVVPAPDEAAEKLELPARAPVVLLRRLRLTGGEPLAILQNYLPVTVAEPDSAELRHDGLYALLRTAGVSIKVARQRIGARIGSPDECQLLAEPPASTLLTIERLALDDVGRPVEWGQHLYRADRYSVSTTLT